MAPINDMRCPNIQKYGKCQLKVCGWCSPPPFIKVNVDEFKNAEYKVKVDIENHEHDYKLVGAIANTHLCFKCGKELVANEIEILNQYYEVGGFCNDEKCERFLLLVI